MVMQGPAAEEPAATSTAAKQTVAAGEAAEAAAISPEAATQQEDGSQDSTPLPLPYVLDANGKKQPLAGAKSIFIRSELTCSDVMFRAAHNQLQHGFSCKAQQIVTLQQSS